MASYAILKPVRDAMASDWEREVVSSLWTGTFLFSFVAIGLYSTLASGIRLKWLVPGVYVFFALTFVAFYASRSASSRAMFACSPIRSSVGEVRFVSEESLVVGTFLGCLAALP